MKRAVASSLLAAVLAGTAVWAQTPPPPGPEAPPPEAPPPEAALTQPAAPVVAPPPPKAPAAPAVPLKRPRLDQAVVQVLDKVTAGSVRLTLDVGKTAAYQSLIFTVRACETNAADEPRAEAASYMIIDSQPTSMGRRTPPKTVFKGWMYASSPSLAPFEHPVYDVWMIGCKSSQPAPPAPPPPPPPKPAAPKPVTPTTAVPGTTATAAPAAAPAAPRPAPAASTVPAPAAPATPAR